ncbi:glycosyltransferase [Bosea sp. 2RAB26]|uniref:glycosyltransferase n=1 Tax=Bosea sp. 2RAB26 TaxID=3237476 RepID=UPI003F93A633
MAGPDIPWAKRLQHRLLAGILRIVDVAAGPFSPRLRGVTRYLAGLVDQGRHAEVDVLMAQGARKIMSRVLPGRGDCRARRRDRIVIDARSQRFDAAGAVIAKPAPAVQPALLASIVIPCFNYGRFVVEAVRSAQAQTVASIEVIVVDDGSTDPSTVAVLDRLAADGEITLIRTVNQGLPAARNSGIAAARGEYICCLDADDLIEPVYLEATIALMRTDSSVGFAFSHVRFFGDVEETWETRDFDIDEALVSNFTAVSAVFRRDDWEAAGGYAPIMRGGFEDWEFWIRLSALGRRGRVIRHPLFLHRRHGRTMTHDAKDMQEELQSRIRTLNPVVFGDARLRARIRAVAGQPGPVEDRLADLTHAIRRMDKPGLLVVAPWLRRGGAEGVLLSALAGLAASWHVVLITTEADDHLMTGAFRAVSPEIFHLDGILDEEHRAAFVAHLVASRRVTHVLSSGSAWFLKNLPALAAQTPGGLKAANIIHNEVPDSVYRAAIAAGSALGIHIAVSGPVKRSLRAAGVAPDRIVHIANGIDAVPFVRAASRRATLREAMGLSPATRLLVWIGRMGVEKRPEAFVGIVARLAPDGALRAVMAGDGPLGPEVDRAIQRHGLGDVIVRRGHVNPAEVAELLAAADMLVLTSAVEGAPLVVLEALATGCPVAVTRVGDVPTIITDNENGVLCDPVEPLALADAIVRAFTQGLHADPSRDRIQMRFMAGDRTQAAMAARYEAVLRGLT